MAARRTILGGSTVPSLPAVSVSAERDARVDPDEYIDIELLEEAEENGVDLKWRILSAKRQLRRRGIDKERVIRRMYKIPDDVSLTTG